MNKYQRAVKRCELDLEDRIENDEILMCGRIDIEILNELVDRATPKKPLVVSVEFSTYEEPDCWVDVYKCPSCEKDVYYDRCCQNNDCRQAIDWGKDDER